MSWRIERVSSEDPIFKKILSDENHLVNFQDKVLDIFGVVKQPEGRSWGMTHMITAWADIATLKDDNGHYQDLAVHINGEQLLWQPFVEYLMIKRILEDTEKVDKFKMGHIDGRMGHLRHFNTTGHMSATTSPGYTFWTEVN